MDETNLTFGDSAKLIFKLCKNKKREIVFGYDWEHDLYLFAIQDKTEKDAGFHIRKISDLELNKWSSSELKVFLLTGRVPDGESTIQKGISK